MTPESIRKNNGRILALLSQYINLCPDAITPEMMEETVRYCGVGEEEAFRILISGILDVFEDKELRGGWISKMFTRLDREKYENDPYKKTIKLPAARLGEWEFTVDRYKPYEAFVYNDLRAESDGRIIPQIGFFDGEYAFPCVKQAGREWMLITPNEIETMAAPVETSWGKVLTYGLGLGYFAFMASEKETVESVTVVELDQSVIDLFTSHILPQFPHGEKIKIVKASAFEFAKEAEGFDFVFADIWHDPSDGCEAYLRLKKEEKPNTRYAYWIEDTLKYYLSL